MQTGQRHRPLDKKTSTPSHPRKRSQSLRQRVREEFQEFFLLRIRMRLWRTSDGPYRRRRFRRPRTPLTVTAFSIWLRRTRSGQWNYRCRRLHCKRRCGAEWDRARHAKRTLSVWARTSIASTVCILIYYRFLRYNWNCGSSEERIGYC